MRIIREGKLPKEVWIGKCPYCGSEIEAETKELVVDDQASREEEEEIRWGRCLLAGCGTTVLFRKKRV